MSSYDTNVFIKDKGDFLMNVLMPFITLAIGLLSFAVLYYLSKKVSFSIVTIVAMLFGIVIGVAFKDSTEYLGMIGSIFSRLISVVVLPLLMVSLVRCIYNMESIKELRSIGFKSVFWLLIQTMIAAGVTLFLCLATNLGVNSQNLLPVEGYVTKEIPPISKTIIDLFPRNIFESLSNGKIISCLIFAILIGIAVVAVDNKKSGAVKPFKDLINACHEIIYYVVDLIIGFLPFAIVSLMAQTIARSDGDILKPLLHTIVLTFAACFIHMYLTGGLLLALVGKINPVKFFSKILPAQVTAFTTQSSIATLPLNIECLTKRVGVPEKTANFVGSLGTTLGMAACAGIWPTILAVFAVNSLGIEFSAAQYALLIVLTPLISLGTVGVPGGGMLTATALFLSLGLPVEVVAIFASIDAFVDMARTACNVSNAMSSATLVAVSEKSLDKEVFGSKNSDIRDKRIANNFN